MSGLSDYFKRIGARPVDPATIAAYDRAMREEVIPAIESDMRAARRANHFARLGIPDPLASVGRNAKRHDNEDWHGPKDKHATAEGGDAQP